MPAEQYHGFPLSPNRTWDASAAEPGLRRWASSDGSGDKDKIDWNKLRKVYFWHEAGELSEFGQLKFPYCRIEDGEPHVVHNAVQNALARIEGSNIPADDKPAVRRVAQRQLDRFQDNSSANSMNYSSGNSDNKKFGFPTDEQLAKINKLAKVPLSKDEVFVFPSKLAGDMIIPDRYVQLTKELLEIFTVNANSGVSLLLDHSWHPDGFWGLGGRPKAAIPYGRTFEASLAQSAVEGESISLNANTYMKRGIEIDGIKTDDLIASIEAGTLFDTSIGFSYDKGICSVCGKNYFNGKDCEHIAGRTYEVEGEDGVTRNVLCYVRAYPPGQLWENSLVFDGAYPTAGVLSKNGDIFENENGIYQVVTDLKGIDKPIVATYSQRTGLLTMIKKSEYKKPYALGGLVQKAQDSITDRDSIFALGKKIGVSREQVVNIANLVLKGGEKRMDEKVLKMLEAFKITYKEGETKVEDVLSQIAEKWDATVKAIQDSAAPLKEMECIVTKEQKAEYDTYRKETIDSAIAWGVRAMGNDFPADTWKKTFETMDKKAIEDIAKTWEAQAKEVIPAGRKTDPAAGLGQQNKTADLPEEAFKVKK